MAERADLRRVRNSAGGGGAGGRGRFAMTSVEVWLAILGMTVVTAVTRAMFLIGGERTVLPARVQRMLRYAPAAALAAVVLPDVLRHARRPVVRAVEP